MLPRLPILLRTFPTLLNSGVAVENPRATEPASGRGEVAIIPFFNDITGAARIGGQTIGSPGEADESGYLPLRALSQ